VPVTTVTDAAPTPTTGAVAVAESGPSFTDTLPATGQDIQPLWLVAAEAMLLGLALLGISRRRTNLT
jgi:LPXTG-motif cell wall-anchored protein